MNLVKRHSLLEFHTEFCFVREGKESIMQSTLAPKFRPSEINPLSLLLYETLFVMS